MTLYCDYLKVISTRVGDKEATLGKGESVQFEQYTVTYAGPRIGVLMYRLFIRPHSKRRNLYSIC